MKEITFPFLDHIGASLKSTGNGKAEIELDVRPHHLQYLGHVHGGVISTLMEEAGWHAAVSDLEEGHTVETMEIKVNYLRPTYDKHLIASARIKDQGHTTVFVTIELEDDENLVAFATGTYAILHEK